MNERMKKSNLTKSLTRDVRMSMRASSSSCFNLQLVKAVLSPSSLAHISAFLTTVMFKPPRGASHPTPLVTSAQKKKTTRVLSPRLTQLSEKHWQTGATSQCPSSPPQVTEAWLMKTDRGNDGWTAADPSGPFSSWAVQTTLKNKNDNYTQGFIVVHYLISTSWQSTY